MPREAQAGTWPMAWPNADKKTAISRSAAIRARLQFARRATCLVLVAATPLGTRSTWSSVQSISATSPLASSRKSWRGLYVLDFIVRVLQRLGAERACPGVVCHQQARRRQGPPPGCQQRPHREVDVGARALPIVEHGDHGLPDACCASKSSGMCQSCDNCAAGTLIVVCGTPYWQRTRAERPPEG